MCRPSVVSTEIFYSTVWPPHCSPPEKQEDTSGLCGDYIRIIQLDLDFWVCYFGEVEKGPTLVLKQDLPTVKHEESKVKERTRNLLPFHLIKSHRKAEMSVLWMGYSFLVDVYTHLNCYISEEMWKDYTTQMTFMSKAHYKHLILYSCIQFTPKLPSCNTCKLTELHLGNGLLKHLCFFLCD